jgi:hypothetical protein
MGYNVAMVDAKPVRDDVPPIEEVERVLPQAWCRRTAHKKQFIDTNPAWGQCGATALMVRRLYGGQILKTTVVVPDDWKGYGPEMGDGRSNKQLMRPPECERPKSEKWKAVVGWEDIFEVSNCGQVRRSTKRRTGPRTEIERVASGELIEQSPWGDYASVDLKDGERRSRQYVHRLVAEAFIGLPPSSLHQVDHLDTRKENNWPENMEWVTAGEQRRRWHSNRVVVTERAYRHYYNQLPIGVTVDLTAVQFPFDSKFHVHPDEPRTRNTPFGEDVIRRAILLEKRVWKELGLDWAGPIKQHADAGKVSNLDWHGRKETEDHGAIGSQPDYSELMSPRVV